MHFRVEFSKWWSSEFKTVKFPTAGTLFDYCIDPETKKFVSWSESVGTFTLDPDIPLQVIPIHSKFCEIVVNAEAGVNVEILHLYASPQPA